MLEFEDDNTAIFGSGIDADASAGTTMFASGSSAGAAGCADAELGATTGPCEPNKAAKATPQKAMRLRRACFVRSFIVLTPCSVAARSARERERERGLLQLGSVFGCGWHLGADL